MEPVYTYRDNLEYMDDLYQRFAADPKQVPTDWRQFFQTLLNNQSILSPNGAMSVQPAPVAPPPCQPPAPPPPPPAASVPELEGLGEADMLVDNLSSAADVRVHNLVHAFRMHGHLEARLNPLDSKAASAKALNPATYGLTKADDKTSFLVDSPTGLCMAPLNEIIQKWRSYYCSTLSCRMDGCTREVQEWFQEEFEREAPRFQLSDKDKHDILHSLVRTQSLEQFIHTRFVGSKRFSIEGGDALMPMLEVMIKSGTTLGMEEIVVGMAHRGRVNVLANFMGSAIDVIFGSFSGQVVDMPDYSGDVKYHLGYSADKISANGGRCHVSLAFNPSHLEAVNPVVMGMTRAKQRQRGDDPTRNKVVPLLIHGDAAFIGQGIVSESLQLSGLQGYGVGGTVHIIVNNQVGFTTHPHDSRSTQYSSDLSKSIQAPVLLVNGDDVEACVRAMDMALRFRQHFKQDVVIDMICYRRYGHNEGDEPGFTQPLMYKKIKSHPRLMDIYLKKLIQQGLVHEQSIKKLYQEKMEILQKELEAVRKNPPQQKPNAFEGQWKGLKRGGAADFMRPIDTSFAADKLNQLAQVLTQVPEDFNLHPKLQKLVSHRQQMLEQNKIDWGFGELLTYASLLFEGTSVRMTGQDVKRGTFSHRHAVYCDTETGEEFCALNHVHPKAEFCIYNSLLSEMAVLGFEYGNAISDPLFLTIWEAQFGDFANGAQIIIDQFISSGEEKWARSCGLVLYLPHAYEGQGPEHSSARLERFLQLAAGPNMQVCNLTTPANLFHVLRRQMKRDFRKPLVIMTPKSLLRHPQVVSSVDDFAKGQFCEVLGDTPPDAASCQKVLLCTGKVYYDLQAYRQKHNLNVALVRLEQIAPFPEQQLRHMLASYPSLEELMWVQEEPKNMGALTYVKEKLELLFGQMPQIKLAYVGRERRSSPATGSPQVHAQEQAQLMKEALGGD